LNCQETQNWIDGYVDGELDLARSLEVEHHLRECTACARAVQDRQRLSAAIRAGSLYHAAPAGLRRRVLSSVRKAGKEAPAARVMPWLLRYAALAAVLVMAWGAWRALPASPAEEALTQEVVAGHIRSLMAGHLMDVASTDQHTVKPWFNGKLDFAPPVEDLADQGFPLVGGRLDYLDNRPVAALVYRRRQHCINLFLWPSTQDSERATPAAVRGYHLIRWTQSGMHFWAVSDLNSRELQTFVQLLQARISPGAR
jgi:anti-sigma factor RsiW